MLSVHIYSSPPVLFRSDTDQLQFLFAPHFCLINNSVIHSIFLFALSHSVSINCFLLCLFLFIYLFNLCNLGCLYVHCSSLVLFLPFFLFNTTINIRHPYVLLFLSLLLSLLSPLSLFLSSFLSSPSYPFFIHLQLSLLRRSFLPPTLSNVSSIFLSPLPLPLFVQAQNN